MGVKSRRFDQVGGVRVPILGGDEELPELRVHRACRLDRMPSLRGAARIQRVDDARAHCERARSHGAQIGMEPTDFEYGERQYAAEDPAGHRWTFSETLEDVDPGTWGGTPVKP